MLDDGRLGCWGDGVVDELEGITTTLPRPPEGAFTTVSVGEAYGCAIREDGTLACWGTMDGVQVVPPAGTFTAVSIDGGLACAIRSDGELACWGTAAMAGPTPPAGAYRDLSLGHGHACAVATGGALVCWRGNEETAPTGTFTAVSSGWTSCAVRTDGSLACWTGEAHVRLNAPPAGTFAAIGVGWTSGCAISTAGTLACWLLGESTADDEEEPSAPPTAVVPPSGTFRSLARTSCAIRTDGTLACFDGTPTARPSVSADVINGPWLTQPTARLAWTAEPAFARATSYDVRYRRSYGERRYGAWRSGGTTTATTYAGHVPDGATLCYQVRAHDADGLVSRWTSAGCLTLPMDDRSLARSAGWTALTGSAYTRHTALRTSRFGATLRTGRTAAYWIALEATICPGCGSVMVLHDGRKITTVSLASPRRVDRVLIPILNMDDYQDWPEDDDADGTVDDYVPYLAHGTFTLKVVSIGRPVIIDGLLLSSERGQPSWANAGNPPAPAAFSSAHVLAAISAGYQSTCAIRQDGTLACWGVNSEGQARPVTGAFTVVATASYAACAIRQDGTLARWGGNDSDVLTPPGGEFADIAAGSDSFCGLRPDGTIACWGLGEDGAAPAGTFASLGRGAACGVRTDGTLACWNLEDGQRAFLNTLPDGTFSRVASDWSHACAVRTDGRIVCWGSDDVGESRAPEGTFTDVGVGDGYSCGLRTDGTIACWGDDHFLQSSPPGGRFTTLSVGSLHACAIRAEGGFACWGQDLMSQTTPRPIARTIRVAPVTLTGRMRIGWSSTGLLPGASATIRVRRAAFDRASGPWSIARRDMAGTTASLGVRPGRTVCASVQVRDTEGRHSRWTGAGCSSAPLDERVLVRSTGWMVASGDQYYRGTALKATRRGATLRLGGLRPGATWLVVSRGPGFGRIEVLWNGEQVNEWDLSRDDQGEPLATREDRVILQVAGHEDLYENGTLVIRVMSSGSPVIVDGIAMYARPLD